MVYLHKLGYCVPSVRVIFLGARSVPLRADNSGRTIRAFGAIGAFGLPPRGAPSGARTQENRVCGEDGVEEVGHAVGYEPYYRGGRPRDSPAPLG